MLNYRSAFTLIELLVVIGIIAILAAILFPVFARAKAAAKTSACLSNEKQLALATALYLADSNDIYPETKDPSTNPSVDDANGDLNQPDYGSIFVMLSPYIQKSEDGVLSKVLVCPEDTDPFGSVCVSMNPDTPTLSSYIVNAYYIFGLNDTEVLEPAQSIEYSERRSNSNTGALPYCDYAYYPWFNPSNPSAPENDMDPTIGAVATVRHNDHSNFVFADGHVKTLAWGQTYNPPLVNLHTLGN